MSISDYVVFDIETVPCAPSFDEASEAVQNSFLYFCERKFPKELNDQGVNSLFLEKAGLMPEFADVVCISIGTIKNNEYKIISLLNENNDSTEMLSKFASFCDKLKPNFILCGYNILNFDIPFLVKHMIQKGITVPKKLNMWGTKPWERSVFDVFEFWKGHSSYLPSLFMVSSFLGCGNPKEKINGSHVGPLFYGTSELASSKKEGLNIIKTYCEGDVMSTFCTLEKIVNSGCL